MQMTSGDYEVAMSAPFRVEFSQGMVGFDTYAEASAYKKQYGGAIRARGA